MTFALKVGLLATPGMSIFHLAVPSLVFGEDRRAAGIPRFDLRIHAEADGHLDAASGYSLRAKPLSGLRRVDVLIVPTWPHIERPPSRAFCDALRQAHASGTLVVGLCLGAFALAHAGLLDGRAATTHWQWSEAFSSRFPAVEFDPRPLYVEDDGVLTSAGTAAALDCCLHIVRTRVGAEAAARLGRSLVLAPHRSGGQAQFIEHPIGRDRRRDALAQASAWALQNLAAPIDIDAFAERAAMSRRNFTRRFRQRHGISVAAWLLRQRIALAQRLLETSDASIEQVAVRAGFGSPATLRQAFAVELETSPSQYRAAFRHHTEK